MIQKSHTGPLLAFAGVTFAALAGWAAFSRRDQKAIPAGAADGSRSALAPAASANLPEPQPAEATVDQVIINIIDDIVPGLRISAADLRDGIQSNPDGVRQALTRYRATAGKFAQQLLAQQRLTAQRMLDAQQILDGLSKADVAFNVIGQIPVIGSFIKGLYQLGRMFAVAEADAQAEGRHVTQPRVDLGVETFFGWLADDAGSDGDFWAVNLPVMSFVAPIQANQYLVATGEVYAPQLQALVALCEHFPYGCPVPRIDCTQSRQYNYKFNKLGNNDLSDAAGARGEIYWVDVWAPEDISTTGPVGFDPANPRAWYGPAQAKALGLNATAPPLVLVTDKAHRL